MPGGGFKHGAEGADAVIAAGAGAGDAADGLAACQQGQGVGQHGLLSPLQVTHAQLLLEEAGGSAFSGAHVGSPFGQAGALARVAQGGVAQGAQAFVAVLGVRQRHAQRLGIGSGDFVDDELA